MDTPRNPPLSERFASIFSMMLAMLRAQGWRALLHLPSLWLAMRMIRELGEALGALAAAFEAGTLPPIPPAPVLAPLEPLPARPASTSPRARTRAPTPRRAPPTTARIPRRSRRVPAFARPRPLPTPISVVLRPALRKNPAFAIRFPLALFVTIS
jgi:hypothetical protein